VAAFLPSSASPTGRERPTATVHLRWYHIASTVAYLGSMAYYATLGGAFDRDHWSRSAVYDVTIIDHFVKWSRQALPRTLQFQHLINNTMFHDRLLHDVLCFML